MSCINCKSSRETWNKVLNEDFDLGDLIKKEIVYEGRELYHLGVGTTFRKGQVSKDTGALAHEDHLNYENLPMYHLGSIGYKNIITYIGVHCCSQCKKYWWVELHKKKDLRIVDYVGPFQDSVTEFFDLEATVSANTISVDISDALQNFTLDNYYLLGSKTDLFSRFYDVQLTYFEAIVKTESERMFDFFKSEAYKEIQHNFYVRNQWEEFMQRLSRKKKKKK